MKLSIVKETISPKKAMEYLKRNVCNRPLSRATWRGIKTDIEAGQYLANGETIKFNGNGDLIDGQHRLTACFEAGIPIETYVCRGLPHEAFDTIDQGKRRSIGDVFARQGHKRANQLAAAVRLTFWYANCLNGATEKRAMRAHEANAVLAENPRLHEAADIAGHLYNVHDRLMGPGSLAFLIHECGRQDWNASVEFWTGVMSGVGLGKSDVAYMLRRRLIQNLSESAKLHSDVVTLLGAKAWNFHRAGKPCGTLKLVAGEAFPRISH